MRLFATVLVAWWLALSVTPQAAVPSGIGWSVAWQQGDSMAANALETARPSIWHNWVYDHLDDPTYVPMAYSLRPAAQDKYLEAALTHDSRLWFLGSEPNLASTYIDPAEAAESVRRWQAEYVGPIACCGTVQWAGWREWMDGYLAANGPKTPYCHVHIFDQFAYPPYREFRDWLDANDWQCEIIVSETANPWGTVADNIILMDGLARLVADGSIRAAAWYSIYDWHGIWHLTDLMNADATESTPLGEHLLSLQPGGANDPRATPTPTLEPTAEEESGQLVTPTPEPTTEVLPSPNALWLPRLER